MELTLTEVEDEFVYKEPYIKVSIDRTQHLHLQGEGVGIVEYAKMLAMGLDSVMEDFTDDDEEEFYAWANED